MDAEKALADMEDGCPCREHLHPKAHSPCLFIGRCVCYFGKAECRWTGHARARTLARAAFEERGHVAGCQCGPLRIGLGGNELTYDESNKVIKHADPRCALPKWLTETSR